MKAYRQRQWESIKAGLMALAEPAYQTPRLQRGRAQLEAKNAEIKKFAMQQMVETEMWPDSVWTDKLREELRAHLLPISADAEILLEGMPGIKEFFFVPHKRSKDETLFKTTERVLRHAEEYKSVFVDEGKYATDFIEKAQAAADALKAKLESSDTVINRRSRATASLEPAIIKGRKIMTSITKTVRSELAANPVARKRWEDAARVPKTRGRPKDNRRSRRIFPPPDEPESEK